LAPFFSAFSSPPFLGGLPQIAFLTSSSESEPSSAFFSPPFLGGLPQIAFLSSSSVSEPISTSDGISAFFSFLGAGLPPFFSALF